VGEPGLRKIWRATLAGSTEGLAGNCIHKISKTSFCSECKKCFPNFCSGQNKLQLLWRPGSLLPSQWARQLRSFSPGTIGDPWSLFHVKCRRGHRTVLLLPSSREEDHDMPADDNSYSESGLPESGPSLSVAATEQPEVLPVITDDATVTPSPVEHWMLWTKITGCL